MIRYSLKRLTNPAFDAVTIDRARQQCNVSHNEDNQFLKSCLLAAQAYIEKALECTIGESNWLLTLDRFPASNAPLPIPMWPVKEVTAVRYTDTNGVEQTLSLASITQPASEGRFQMCSVDWQAWPIVRHNPNSVEIEFTAGWSGREDVPPQITQAILMLVAHWYENRESVLIGQTSKEIEFATTALIESIRPGDDVVSDQLGEDYYP